MQARRPDSAVRSLLLLTLLGIGCVTYRGEALTDDPPALTAAHATYGGLIVGVAVPRDEAEVRRYFGRNLLAAGILPVEIALTNIDPGASYELDPSLVNLSYGDGEFLERVDHRRAYEAVRFSQWRALVPWLLVLPGFFVSDEIRMANAAMLDDYRNKEMSRALPLHANTRPAIDGVRRVVYYQSVGPIDLARVRRDGVCRVTVVRLEAGRRLPAQDLVIRLDGR